MPSRRAVASTRRAISPRLATSTDSISPDSTTGAAYSRPGRPGPAGDLGLPVPGPGQPEQPAERDQPWLSRVRRSFGGRTGDLDRRPDFVDPGQHFDPQVPGDHIVPAVLVHQ